MASTNFSILPAAGAESVVLSATTLNTLYDNNDVSATAVIQNDFGNTAIITLIQYGVPIIGVYGGNPVPATGGTFYGAVSSHYDIVFRSVPQWITAITKDNITYTEGQRIPSGQTTGGSFAFHVEANDGNERTTHYFGMNMGHYIGNTLQQRTAEINAVQSAHQDEPYLGISPSTILMDWDGPASASVGSNIAWTAAITGDTGYISFSPTGGTGNKTLNISAATLNTGTTNKTARITLNDTMGSGITSHTDITMLWMPTEDASGLDGSIYYSGGTKYMVINSPYEWYVYQEIPSWLTMSPNYTSASPCTTTGQTQITFTADENDGGERTFGFTLKYKRKDGTIDGFGVYNTITQLAVPDEEYIGIFSAPAIPKWDYDAQSGNTKAWVISANTSWNALSPFEGFAYPYSHTGTTGTTNLYIAYAEAYNESTSYSKNAMVVSNTKSLSIPLYKAKKPTIELAYGNTTPSQYAIPSTGGSKDITIVSDYDWWIRPTPSSYIHLYDNGTQISWPTSSNPFSATTGKTYQFVWDANTGTTENEDGFGLGFTKYDGTTGACYMYSAFTQAAPAVEHYLIVSPRSFRFDSGASLANYFNVSASTAWTASANDNWITLGRQATAGTAGYSQNLVFTISRNDGAARNSAIVFNSDAQGVGNLIMVSQSAAGPSVVNDYIVVIPATGYTNVSSGGSVLKTITISASTDWTATIPDWYYFYRSIIEHDPISGGTSGSETYSIYIPANSGAARSGTTYFYAGTASTTFVITQKEYHYEPQYGNLSLDPAQLTNQSSSQFVEVIDVQNDDVEDFTILYSGATTNDTPWAMFYDRNPEIYPNAQELDVIPKNFNDGIYLLVQAGHHSGTIIFKGDESGQEIGFNISQI